MQQIVHLNNLSVKMMAKGRHQAALKGFRKALNELRSTVKDICSDDHFAHRPILVNDLARVPFANDDDAVSPHNDFCFYRRTVWMNKLDLEDENLPSMVILFNLAVTCHSLGLNKSGEYLSKALELYKMILSVAQEAASIADPAYDAWVRVLLMAVFSNVSLGQDLLPWP